VFAIDPYRERAWRLAMRIVAAYGDDDRVIAVFRRCERALVEVGIAPSPSTRRLLDALRR
jgi:LuxR family transcriptional regulator, maltose regulon positive regulatory protein